jgi:hypothetical protein
MSKRRNRRKGLSAISTSSETRESALMPDARSGTGDDFFGCSAADGLNIDVRAREVIASDCCTEQLGTRSTDDSTRLGRLQLAMTPECWQSSSSSASPEISIDDLILPQSHELLCMQPCWSSPDVSSRDTIESHGRIFRSDSGYSSTTSSCMTPTSLDLSNSLLEAAVDCLGPNFAPSSALQYTLQQNEVTMSPRSVELESPMTPGTMFEITKATYDLEQGLLDTAIPLDARLLLIQRSLAQIQQAVGSCRIGARTSSAQLLCSAIMLLFQHYEAVLIHVRVGLRPSHENSSMIDPRLTHLGALSKCANPPSNSSVSRDDSNARDSSVAIASEQVACGRFCLGCFELDVDEHARLLRRIVRRDLDQCLQICRGLREDSVAVGLSSHTISRSYTPLILAEIKQFALRLEVQLGCTQ